MISTHGFIQYFVKVTIRLNEEIKKFVKEIIVESPIEENLMVRRNTVKHSEKFGTAKGNNNKLSLIYIEYIDLVRI